MRSRCRHPDACWAAGRRGRCKCDDRLSAQMTEQWKDAAFREASRAASSRAATEKWRDWRHYNNLDGVQLRLLERLRLAGLR